MVELSKKGLVKKKVTVKKDGKTFERYQWIKAGEDDKVEKKPSNKETPKGKGSFQIGSTISFIGKDLTIEKVSESQKTVKLSNSKIYTFDAINKGSKIKKIEKKVKKPLIKDLKINKKIKKIEVPQFGEDGFVFQSQFINTKIFINKSELTKAVNVDSQSDETGYAMIPKSYDKKKRQKDEDNTVENIQKWIEDQQDRLEDELKKLYPEL